MPKKQYIEGLINKCGKEQCEYSHQCCDDGLVVEWIDEYFAFHERIKDHLVSKGIKIQFCGDRVKFINCSDGKDCKFLKYSINKDIDSRPIDCKIYPFLVDWETIDFNKKIVKLYYWSNDCPLVKRKSIPPEFKNEVISIIRRDFAVLFHGSQFKIKFMDKVYKEKAKK